MAKNVQIPPRVPLTDPRTGMISREWYLYLMRQAEVVDGAPLSRVNDDNVTLTLGGSPNTALLARTTLTLGWTGHLSVPRGGLGLDSVAPFEMLYASGSDTYAKLAPNVTSDRKFLRMVGDGDNGSPPEWDNPTVGDVTGLQALLDNKSQIDHSHDGVYQPLLGFTPEDSANKGVPGGYAPLGPNGMIPTVYIPPVALSEPYPVASEAEMLTLDVQGGDVAIRSDIRKTFMLKKDGNPSVLSDWLEMQTPTDSVQSVNGYIGVVNLTASDVGASPSGHTHSYLPLAGGTLTGALSGTTAAFSGAVTGASFNSITGLQTGAPNSVGTSNTVGTSTLTARADHAHAITKATIESVLTGAITSHTHADVTTGASGFMTAAMLTKLNGIEAGANNYSLPTASASVLGGIKVGTRLSIDANGVLSASDQSYTLTKTAVESVLTGAITSHTHSYLPLAGGTLTGGLVTAASVVGGSGLRLPHGAAPTTPVNGDVWTTTTGLYARINGATVGPFTSSAGTVTSVGLSLPNIFSVTGSPVTTSGTLTASLASQPMKSVFAAPSGAAGVPTFRALTASDIPSLSGTYLPLTAGVGAQLSGTLHAYAGIAMRGDILLNSGAYQTQTDVKIAVGQTSVPNTEGSGRGRNLTIEAGYYSIGYANQPGGDLILSSGVSSGSAKSRIEFKTPTPKTIGDAGANNPVLRGYIDDTGMNLSVPVIVPSITVGIINQSSKESCRVIKTSNQGPLTLSDWYKVTFQNKSTTNTAWDNTGAFDLATSRFYNKGVAGSFLFSMGVMTNLRDVTKEMAIGIRVYNSAGTLKNEIVADRGFADYGLMTSTQYYLENGDFVEMIFVSDAPAGGYTINASQGATYFAATRI